MKQNKDFTMKDVKEIALLTKRLGNLNNILAVEIKVKRSQAIKMFPEKPHMLETKELHETVDGVLFKFKISS